LKILAATALAICLIATPATTAEITHHPQSKGPDVITLSGFIEEGDGAKFPLVARSAPRAVVVLNSSGGYNEASIFIGRFICTHKFATAVYAGTVCNSSCVTIWLGGYFRHLDPHARLGVHSAALVDDRSKRNELGNQALAEYMRELNVPQQVIELQPKAWPCCLNYITYNQARAWGLINTEQQTSDVLPSINP
jgi:hypothetical protein